MSPSTPRPAQRERNVARSVASPRGQPLRGRGTSCNPPNRFERIEVELDEPLTTGPPMRFLRDATHTIIARNQSPDLVTCRQLSLATSAPQLSTAACRPGGDQLWLFQGGRPG